MIYNQEGCYMDKKSRDISIPLLVFTFFYTIVFYILMIGFNYWHWYKKVMDKE